MLENQTVDPITGRLYPAVKELLVVSGAHGGSRKVVEQGGDVLIKLFFGKMSLAVVVREGLVGGEAEMTLMGPGPLVMRQEKRGEGLRRGSGEETQVGGRLMRQGWGRARPEAGRPKSLGDTWSGLRVWSQPLGGVDMTLGEDRALVGEQRGLCLLEEHLGASCKSPGH